MINLQFLKLIMCDGTEVTFLSVLA